MQHQSTLDTFLNTKTSEMLHKSEPKSYPTLTSWLADSHVRHFLLQEREEGLMTQEERSFLKSQGFSKTKNPNIFFLKTLGVYYLMTKDVLSRQSLGFSPTWGMSFNGRYLTRRISKCHKEENGSILRDILEEEVDQKYYLSEETAAKILAR